MENKYYLTNRATEVTLMWIKHNRYQEYLSQAQSPQQMRELVARKIGGDNRGLGLVRWDSLYEAYKKQDSLPVQKQP